MESMDNNFSVNEGCSPQYRDRFIGGFYYILACYVITIDRIYVRDPELAAKKLEEQLTGICYTENSTDRRLEFIIEPNGCSSVTTAIEVEIIILQIKNIAADIFRVETNCPSFHLSVDVHGVYIGN
jgi:hypothetical protein